MAQAGDHEISKTSKQTTTPAGWWCTAYDRDGRMARIFVPAKR